MNDGSQVPPSTREFAPYQDRVIDDKMQIDKKNSELVAFLSSATFLSLDMLDRQLLIAQQAMMESYSRILGARIARF